MQYTPLIPANHSTKQTVARRQTTLDAACGRSIDKQRQEKLTNAIAKWIATDCRPISVVEDVGLRNILRIATNDGRYEIPSRRTITRRIHVLYEKGEDRKSDTFTTCYSHWGLLDITG